MRRPGGIGNAAKLGCLRIKLVPPPTRARLSSGRSSRNGRRISWPLMTSLSTPTSGPLLCHSNSSSASKLGTFSVVEKRAAEAASGAASVASVPPFGETPETPGPMRMLELTRRLRALADGFAGHRERLTDFEQECDRRSSRCEPLTNALRAD
jgi:hypothetical protein